MGSFFQVIKNFIVGALVLVMVALVGGIIYLNQIGFPGKYGEWMRSELSKRGLEIEFESLRFSPRKGLIATEAKFYANPGDTEPTLTADYISIDIDKSRAFRGQFELREIKISGGSATLSTEDEDKSLTAEDITADIFIQADQRIRIRNASCLIAGLQVNLEADLKLPEQQKDKPSQQSNPDKILHPLLTELARWKIPEDHPPRLSFTLRGDLGQPDSITTEFHFEANDLMRNDYSLGTLSLHGDLRDQLITIDRVMLADESGEAEGQADWDLSKKEGRFDLTSSLSLQHFLKSCFGLEVMARLQQEDAPYIQVQGSLAQREDRSISVKAKGYAELGPFQFLDSPYDGLKSQFSWHNGDLFLQDFEVTHEKGTLTGDLLAKEDLIRYRIHSDLPLQAFSPFIVKDSPTDRLISRFKLKENSVLAVEIAGQMQRHDLRKAVAKGSIRSTGMSYRDIALHKLSAGFEVTPEKIEFSDVHTVLDDTKEAARRRYQGPASDPILVDRIHVDRRTGTTTISNLRGTFWPSPVVRAFAPKTALHIEDNYRFHRPPTLTLNGAFSGRKDQPQHTAFNIAIRTSGQTDYPFLGRHLPLTDLRADFTMKGLKIAVDRLSFSTLEGKAKGTVRVQVHPTETSRYQGNLQWNEISFSALSKVYQFDEVEKGSLNGRINFSGKGDNIRNFDAKGALGLKEGNLVSLPVLGPLSPLMAGILGDKRMGYERAKNGKTNFEIKRGVWQSNNIIATSDSIILTGEGWVDLKTKKMDMTIRANLRGLLGIITLPLQPLRGLFQFRGTGDFTEPKWRSAPFTRPRKGQADPIFKKPARAARPPGRKTQGP